MSLRNFTAARSVVDVPAASYLYLHAVTRLGPDHKRSSAPFSMEERGIDGRSLVLAWDHGDLRYYLSVMRADAVALGRGDSLLLAKPDSIRLRGVHESILNDLRLHATVLPFAFGTVVYGWKELQDRLAADEEHIAKALRTLGETREWTLVVSVLDARLMELQVHDTTEKRREADRQRDMYTSRSPGGRIDVRTLERILIREHQLAEAIHHDLEPLADHAKVQSIVSLQSGSSADWKPILTASYEIRASVLRRFQRQVTDFQYQYLLQELMISLTGVVEKLVLREKA